jgi:hypothetical protein
MKYSELNFRGGIRRLDVFFNYGIENEDKFFDLSFLGEDLMWYEYDKYSIDVGWYRSFYRIVLLGKIKDPWGNLLLDIHVLEHDKIFETLQYVIDNASKYIKLSAFS